MTLLIVVDLVDAQGIHPERHRCITAHIEISMDDSLEGIIEILTNVDSMSIDVYCRELRIRVRGRSTFV